MITDIEGTLATKNMINIIHELYSNVPLIEELTININGDENLLTGFMEFADNYEFLPLGVKNVQFVKSNETKSHKIKSTDYQDELEEILLHYI